MVTNCGEFYDLHKGRNNGSCPITDLPAYANTKFKTFIAIPFDRLHTVFQGIFVDRSHLTKTCCFLYSPCPEQGMGDEFNLMDHSDLYILDFSKYSCVFGQKLSRLLN